MATEISAKNAREKFAEVTNRVKYTGEPVVITKGGIPFVALVRSEDVEELAQLRRLVRLATFDALAAEAAQKDPIPEPSDEDMVKEIRAVRGELYHQRYG